MIQCLTIETLGALLLALCLCSASILFEGWSGFGFLETFLMSMIMWQMLGMLVLMWSCMNTVLVLITVTIATATVRNGHHNRLINISFHVSSLHRILVVAVVLRRVWIIVFVLLRREIGMVNLLIALWHSIVRIIHWRRRISSLAIRVIRRAHYSLALVSVMTGILSNLLRRILSEGVIWGEKGLDLSFLII